MFFSEYAEGSSNNKYLEIFNGTNDVVNLNEYALASVSNEPETTGQHEYWRQFASGATISPGDVYVIAHPHADNSILALADETHIYLFNGNDGYALVKGTEDNYVIIDSVGDFNGDPGSGWDVAGVTNGTQDHTLVRKSSVTQGNGGDWLASRGTNAEDSEWIVYPKDTWTHLGSHTMDQPVATTSGDPHIFPLYGEMYELPQTPNIYRLLQGDELYINACTRNITNEEKKEMHQYFSQQGILTDKLMTSLVDDGVFYHKLFIYCDGHAFEFDFDTKKVIFKDKESKTFYKFDKKIFYNHLNKNKYEQSSSIHQCDVSFKHPINGSMSLQLNYFSNPQIKYGIGVKFPMNTNGLDGLLIREYKTDSMRVPTLIDTEYKNGVYGKNDAITKMIIL